MKKFLLIALAFLVGGIAFAAVKVAYLSKSGTDQVFTSDNIQLVDASIYFKGATVGDMIQLRNGSASTSPIILTVVAATANDAYLFTPAEPIQIDGGIYMDGTFSSGTTTSGATLMFQ